MSQQLAHKPFSSRELLVKHVEFAARFGAPKALKPMSIGMSAVEYHNLDLLAVVIVLLLSFSYVVVKAALFVVSRVAIVKKTKSE